jgi:predicted NUDIX family NTP pyrophosphohydrolase
MPKISAGLLLYRLRNGQFEVLLVHPGGPFWRKKDEGAWSLPKGEVGSGEDPLGAARREVQEETGFTAGEPFRPLHPVRQKSGKWVHAWACEGDCDTAALKSNTFSMEWPPKSGRQQEFPEVDRAEFFTVPQARQKISPHQLPLLDELAGLLEGNASTDGELKSRA